ARDGARPRHRADDRRHCPRRPDRARSPEDARGDARWTRDVLPDPGRPLADGRCREDRRRTRARPLLQHPARRRRRDRDQPADLDGRLPGGPQPPLPRGQACPRRARRRGAGVACRARPADPQGAPLFRPGGVGQLRVVHCPVNFAGIGWTNVQALRHKGVDARLVVFNTQPAHPEADEDLGLPEGPFWRRQFAQFRALARLLPTTDVFHFYFGLTVVPKLIQFPVLRAARKKSVFHFVGSDIRGKSPEELAYGRRADAQIIGSYDAARWIPEAEVVPPGIDLSGIEAVPP